jgi:integrase
VSAKPASARDPFKRYTTRYPGISYRTKEDGSRTYYVTVGSRHLRVDGGEQEALLVQADLRGKKARGLRVTPPPTSFRAVAETWFRRGCVRWASSTQDGYRTSLELHVLPVFGDLPIAAITTDMIAGFIADRRAAGADDDYIIQNLRPLNGTFKLALRDGVITASPMAGLLSEERPKPSRRKRRAWTPADLKALVEAARTLGSRPGQVYDYTLIIIVAISTGLRISEILGLRWQDVDLKEGVLRVRGQLERNSRELTAPKTEAGIRDVPISPLLVAELRRHRISSQFSQADHFLFCSKTGRPLDRGNVRRRGFAAAVALAGLNRPGEPKLTLHDLRHAFASVVAHHGFSAVDVAVFMGHADSRVTEQVYLHPYDEAATAERLRAVIDEALREHLAGPVASQPLTRV